MTDTEVERESGMALVRKALGTLADVRGSIGLSPVLDGSVVREVYRTAWTGKDIMGTTDEDALDVLLRWYRELHDG